MQPTLPPGGRPRSACRDSCSLGCAATQARLTPSRLARTAGGALGAAEGVSYLVILGIVGWSVATKVGGAREQGAGECGSGGAWASWGQLAVLAGRLTCMRACHERTSLQSGLARPQERGALVFLCLRDARGLREPPPPTWCLVPLCAAQVKTGSGLPAGPAGLLGAVEGFSYLSLLAGIVVAGLNAAGI